jgi:hypothetical protein
VGRQAGQPRLFADRLPGTGLSPGDLSSLRVFCGRPLLDGLTVSQKAYERGLDFSLAELVHQPMQLLARSHVSKVPAPVVSIGATTSLRAMSRDRLRPVLG